MTLKIPKKTFDEPITIDIIENFTNLIKPALQLKFAGTDNEYEKEKEIRAVFRTPSNFVEQVNGDKKFIEIKLNSNLFFASLQGIKICPHAVNKNNLLNEINELNTLVISKNQSPIKIL